MPSASRSIVAVSVGASQLIKLIKSATSLVLRRGENSLLLSAFSTKSAARVDPPTSILAVLARSRQILNTSWQPWILWQDSYQDHTKIIHNSKIVSYHDGQNSKIIKTLYLQYKQPRLKLKAHFNDYLEDYYFYPFS